MKRIFLFLLLILIIPGTVSAGYGCSPNCYVAASGGSNSNLGTIGSPWATPTYGATQIAPGDTIWLFDGTWNDEEIVMTDANTALKRYNGTPTLKRITTSDTGHAILSDHDNGITIDGITIDGYYNSIGIQYMSGLTITNCTIKNGQGGGYGLALYYGVSNFVISNNIFLNHRGGGNVIDLESQEGSSKEIYNGVIINNTIFNTTGHNAINLAGQSATNVPDDRTMWNISILNNNITQCYTNCIAMAVNYLTLYDVNISNNIIKNVAAGVSLSIHNGTVINNTVSDTTTGIIFGMNDVNWYSTNVTYLNNNIHDGGYGIYQITGTALTYTGTDVYNTAAQPKFTSTNGAVTITDTVNASYTIRGNGGVVTVNYSDNGAFLVDGVSKTTYTTSDTSIHTVYRAGGFPRQEASSTPTYIISGYVNDSTSMIQGVSVTMNTSLDSDISLSNGSYTLTSITNGSHNLSFSKSGYNTSYLTVVVNGANLSNQNTTMNLTPATAVQSSLLDNVTVNQGTGRTELRQYVDDSILYIRCDGNVVDDKLTYNGSITGTVNTSADGKYGTGCYFDGLDYNYVYGDNALVTTYPVSMSTWVKLPTDLSVNAAIFQILDSSAPDKYLALRSGGVNVAIASARNTTDRTATGTTQINDSAWHHLVAQFVNNTYREIIVDGVLEDTDVNSVLIPTSDKWCFGSMCDTTLSGNATQTIDEIRVYNRTLSIAEINLQRNQSKYLIGNWTQYSDAGIGFTHNQITVNASTIENTNYSITVYNRSSGEYLTSYTNLTGNNTKSFATTQNVTANITLYGNGTATPEIILVEFDSQEVQDNNPPEDCRLRENTPNTVLCSTEFIDAGYIAGIGRYRGIINLSLSGIVELNTTYFNAYWYYESAARTNTTYIDIYRPAPHDLDYVSWNDKDNNVTWNTSGGDWIDAAGTVNGSVPFATLEIPSDSVESFYSADVSTLVAGYVNGTWPNNGFFLKERNETEDYIAFYSLNYTGDTSKIPYLYSEIPLENYMPPAPINCISTNTTTSINVSCEHGIGNITNELRFYTPEDGWYNTTDLNLNITGLGDIESRTVKIYSWNNSDEGTLNTSYATITNTTAPLAITSYTPADLTPTIDVNNLATFMAGANKAVSWTWTGVTEGAGDGTTNSTATQTWTTTGAKTVTVTCSIGIESCGTIQWDVTVVSDGSGGGINYDWLSGTVIPADSTITINPTVTGSPTTGGAYTFGYIFVDGDSYWVNVSKSGYQSNNTSITFNEDNEIWNTSLISLELIDSTSPENNAHYPVNSAVNFSINTTSPVNYSWKIDNIEVSTSSYYIKTYTSIGSKRVHVDIDGSGINDSYDWQILITRQMATSANTTQNLDRTWFQALLNAIQGS